LRYCRPFESRNSLNREPSVPLVALRQTSVATGSVVTRALVRAAKRARALERRFDGVRRELALAR